VDLNEEFTLTAGVTYIFDQSDPSNENHPLRFSTSSNEESRYITDVISNGTPGNPEAYTSITVTNNTPSTLYYYCTNHSGMGGRITITKEIEDLIIDNGNNYLTYPNAPDEYNLFFLKVDQLGNTANGNLDIVIFSNPVVTTLDYTSIKIAQGYNLILDDVWSGIDRITNPPGYKTERITRFSYEDEPKKIIDDPRLNMDINRIGIHTIYYQIRDPLGQLSEVKQRNYQITEYIPMVSIRIGNKIPVPIGIFKGIDLSSPYLFENMHLITHKNLQNKFKNYIEYISDNIPRNFNNINPLSLQSDSKQYESWYVCIVFEKAWPSSTSRENIVHIEQLQEIKNNIENSVNKWCNKIHSTARTFNIKWYACIGLTGIKFSEDLIQSNTETSFQTFPFVQTYTAHNHNFYDETIDLSNKIVTKFVINQTSLTRQVHTIASKAHIVQLGSIMTPLTRDDTKKLDIDTQILQKYLGKLFGLDFITINNSYNILSTYSILHEIPNIIITDFDRALLKFSFLYQEKMLQNM
jgi:hypothetical protein